MEKHRKPIYRSCIVPMCKNSIKNAPHKQFFLVPRGEEIRSKWCQIMKRDMTSPSTCLYICEDHFNVEEDTDNYIQYQIMTLHMKQKTILRLKKGILPHKFDCQKDALIPLRRQGFQKRNLEIMENCPSIPLAKKSNQTSISLQNNYLGPSTTSSFQTEDVGRKCVCEADCSSLCYEQSRQSVMSLEAVSVKVEPEWEDEGGLSEAGQADWCTDREVKDEPDWESEAGAGVSEAAARAGLYKDHQVKDELVLGPEILQPPDVAFALQDRTREKYQRIPPKINKSRLFVGGILKKRKIKTTGEKSSSVSGQVYSATDAHVDKMPVVKHLKTANITKESTRYKCGHCSYASNHKGNFLAHEIKHTGEKPYKCNHCSYASANKSHLLLHERQHTGEKPYKCNHCSYASANKSHLMVHERKHTGEKPYKCNHCSFASAQKRNLRAHERKHDVKTRTSVACTA